MFFSPNKLLSFLNARIYRSKCDIFHKILIKLKQLINFYHHLAGTLNFKTSLLVTVMQKTA